MSKKSLLVVFSIIIILLVIYYQLGGFNTVEMQLVETDDYIIAGKAYQGVYKEDSLKDYFFQMKKYVDDDILEGTVCVVSYDLNQASKDSVYQFIGVHLQNASFEIPEEIQLDTVHTQSVIRAIIQAHPMVMPSPDQVIEKIRKFAQSQDLVINNYSIEQYVEDDQIWVDVPLSIDAY